MFLSALIQFQNEEKITEKVLNTALESVFYNEEQGHQLINMLLREEEDKEGEEKEEEKKNIVETEQMEQENREAEKEKSVIIKGTVENVVSKGFDDKMNNT